MTLPLTAGMGRVVSLVNPITALSVVTDPTDATAQYQLTNGGRVRRTVSNNTVVDVGSWVVPNLSNCYYECFATLDSGTLTSGTTGSWLVLTSTRTWTLESTGPGLQAAQITVTIRHLGTTAIVATSVVTLNAEVSV